MLASVVSRLVQCAGRQRPSAAAPVAQAFWRTSSSSDASQDAGFSGRHLRPLHSAAAIALGVSVAGATCALADGPAPIKVELSSGKKVEVIPPASGEWSVKLTPARPPTNAQPPVAPSLPGPFQLPPPPYALDALEPHMSRETLEFHWGKHHRAYVENLNKQVAGTELEKLPLEQVVVKAFNKGKPLHAFNNAAQVWNHTFFWNCMKQGGGGKPSGPLADAIVRDFGSLEKFAAEFKAAGQTQFGSGWAWLVSDDEGKLSILKTGNAVTPLVSGWNCILTCDVWEHAYYLDYQNRRPDYISTFLQHLVDWGAAGQRYAQVLSSA